MEDVRNHNFIIPHLLRNNKGNMDKNAGKTPDRVARVIRRREIPLPLDDSEESGEVSGLVSGESAFMFSVS